MKKITSSDKFPKGRRINFGRHLFLDTRRTGSRWFTRQYENGIRREITLGYWPDMSVEDAHQAADHASVLAQYGALSDLHPHTEKKLITFGEIWEEAIDNRKVLCRWTNEKAELQCKSAIRRYALPALGALPICVISTNHILRVLKPIWETKTSTARKLLDKLSAVFKYAKSRGLLAGDNPAEWDGNLDSFLPQPDKIHQPVHFKAADLKLLTEVIMPKLLASSHIAKLATAFGVFTALRAQEFACARWDELSEDGQTLTIPWQRIKTAKSSKIDFRVPLSKQAQNLLKRVQLLAEEIGIQSEYIFPTLPYRALNPNSPRRILREISQQNITMHGMRSTFRDWAEKTGVPDSYAEKSLNHSLGNSTKIAYLRTDLLDERRPIMQKWADEIAPDKK